MPERIAFKHDTVSSDIETSKLGMSVDYEALSKQVMRQRAALPVLNLIGHHHVATVFTKNQPILDKALTALQATFAKSPSNATIERKDNSFEITNDTAGQSLDIDPTETELVRALASGATTVPVVVHKIAASITSQSLKSELQTLNQQLKTAVSLSYNNQTKRLSANDIIRLYSIEDSKAILSDPLITDLVSSTGSAWGITVKNQSQAATAIKNAIHDTNDATIALQATPAAKKTVYWCSSLRGVSESELPALNSKLQATYNDIRGWSLGGLVRFEKSDANCQLHVWLATADQMPGFGAICDPVWSCTVHPNVIINYDRWRYASEAWNAQKGNLEDYRAMVINHESGHWFGFDHTSCPGPGQPAPLMQQQSIDLQGCTFNPWPTASEQAALKQSLGL